MKLPRQLSPQAKKAVLMSSGQRIQCMVTVSPEADREQLLAEVENLGSNLDSWLGTTQMILDIEDRRLVDLARLRDVMLVELPARWSPAAEDREIE